MIWYRQRCGYIQWRGISRIIRPMTIYMKFLRESSIASTSELAHNVSTTFTSILSYRPSKLRLGRRRTRLPLFRSSFPSQSASLTQSLMLVAPWPVYTAGIITHPPPQPHSLPPATIHAACRIVQPTSPLRGRMLTYWIPG